MSGPRCFRCGSNITAGQTFLNALGHPWHDRCFTCKKCDKLLGTGDFYNLNSEPYCNECHSTHDVPICADCQQPLRRGSDFLRFDGVSYHVHCFTCNNCNRELNTNDFFRNNGKRYCGSCSNRLTSPSPSPSPSYSQTNYNNYSAPAKPIYDHVAPTKPISYALPHDPVMISAVEDQHYDPEPIKSYNSSSSSSKYTPNDNDFSAEISIGVLNPPHNTNNSGGFNYEDNDLNALVNELEKSGSDFNAKYGSSYQPHDSSSRLKDDDPLAAALASLQEFDG